MIGRHIILGEFLKNFPIRLFIAYTENIAGLSGYLDAGFLDRPEGQESPFKEDTIIDDEFKLSFGKHWEDLEQACKEFGLTGPATTIAKIHQAVARPGLTYGKAKRLFDELSGRLSDESNSLQLFMVERDELRYVTERNLFGEDVAASFQKASFDIEEAGKCLAFDRGTACVFHLMRVMELGLRVLGDALGIPSTSNRNWDEILNKADKEMKQRRQDQSPEWQSDEVFFSSAVAHLRSVKIAWRNPTMHIEAKYTEEEAEDIWTHVASFMRHLSTRLSEATD
ncbi:MAG: hypothetical protein IH872_09025 [Chloroflexi bacterium]|nr:hypothetical protein [Chloroflexota bacterium]